MSRWSTPTIRTNGGRTCYLCAGSAAIPDTEDSVTGKLPAFIEIREEYAPRFIDKFFGRYAVLLDTPFARQTVKKRPRVGR